MATQWQICAAQDTAGAEVWQDCGGLGMSNIVRTRQGDGNDTVTFEITAATALTDAALFAFHTYVRIRRVDDGVPTLWFFGRIKTPYRRGTGGASESKKYLIAGPGEQLAATTYRQNWVESTGTVSKPRVVLFQAQNGTRCTSGAQILDALVWAKACGVKIAEPSALLVLTGVALPFDERVNIKCADVVAECLRWHPHAVVWWDYTAREPVFHCALRDSLAAVSIATEAVASDIEITERADIKVPAICLCYEKAVQVDDQSWSNTYFDHAPVVARETAVQLAARLNQPDVVWATFDLDGYARTNVQQEIVTEDFPADYLDKAWWKAREPWLRDYSDGNIILANGGRKLDTTLPRILKEGTMQAWMNKDAAQERICVDATITAYEDDQIVTVEKRPITLWVTATDCTTKTYKKTQSLDTGESVPEGVALELYAEWSGLHFEGSIVVEEQECSGTYAVGKALNITGGMAAWSGMKAMIWRTVEEVDSGATTVEFGPVKTIDADSLVALFRATRNRRFSYNRVFRAGTPVAGDPEGTGASDQTINPGYSGLSTTMRKVVMNKNAANALHKVDINPAALMSDLTNPENTPQTFILRPIEIVANDGPDSKGNARVAVFKAYVLATEPTFVRHDVMSDIPEPGGGGVYTGLNSISISEDDVIALLGDAADAAGLYCAYAQAGVPVRVWASPSGSVIIAANGSARIVRLEGDSDAPSSGTDQLLYVYDRSPPSDADKKRKWIKIGANGGLKVETSSGSEGLRLAGTSATAPSVGSVWGRVGASSYGWIAPCTLTINA